MKKLFGALGALFVFAVIGCAPAFAIDPDAAAKAMEMASQAAGAATPFLPPWFGTTVAVIGGLWTLFITVLRPEIPAENWEKLGKTGLVLDKLAGNRKHTQNAPQANPLNKKSWPRNL